MNSVMASIVAYGASAWAETAKQVVPRRKLNSAQRGVLLRMTGAYHTTPVEALQVILGVLPMDLEVLQRAALYWARNNNPNRVHALIDKRTIHRQEIKTQIMDIWQNRWDTSERGRRTYDLLPNVRERMHLKHFNPSQGLIHYIVGHGPYNTYLQRFGLRESADCECGALGTPDHALMEYPLLEELVGEERRQLRELHDMDCIRNAQAFQTMNKIATKVNKRELELYMNRGNQI